MDEQRGMYLAGKVLTCETAVQLELSVKELWLLMSAAQLTVCHPDLHEPLKQHTEAVGRKLQALIKAELPEVDELAEAGWDRAQDFIDEPETYDTSDADDDEYDWDYGDSPDLYP